ncbi:hypothetical protein FB562_0255 [Homoserinimonas aerilata]|uniref:Uncharacterized protein n=1 Tax=Homoserinimonas aerilata TaxID=1162970 RepID=A0A542YGI6_9MICO|nr:hypothetical protein [Homoserinimonas aerilata]TQL47203.1 hypothetical protein FB562_0255 [Homoserinimonas aerilata]
MSGVARALIMVLASTLPWATRERYREEWLADAEGAGEAGVTQGSVLLGAAAMAVRVNRLAAPDDDTALIATFRRVRWGTALLLASGVIGFGSWVGAGSTVPEVTVAIALMFVVAALAQLGLVARFRGGYTWLAFGLVVIGLGLGVLSLTQIRLLAVLGLFATLAGLILFLVSGPVRMAPSGRGTSSPAARIVAGVAVSLVLVGAVALGALDGFVWMPVALSGGMPLDELRAMMVAANELNSADVMIVIWVVFWAIASLLPAALAVARKRVRVRTIVLLGLGILATLIFFQWWATFSMGMGVADTVPGASGGMSPFGHWFALVGQGALVGIILAVVGGDVRDRGDVEHLVPARA